MKAEWTAERREFWERAFCAYMTYLGGLVARPTVTRGPNDAEKALWSASFADAAMKQWDQRFQEVQQ